jgi:hypothetical protein
MEQDGATFEDFIVSELVPKLREGAGVVMDNAKVHLGEIVREVIEKAGAKLIYLSPYSPCRHSPGGNRQERTRLNFLRLKTFGRKSKQS